MCVWCKCIQVLLKPIWMSGYLSHWNQDEPLPTLEGRTPEMRKQSGFSLIELLIVVAIILIIAAIANP
jgi:prepilin-type N-terminal cleavage/methylation domain-containing protein